MLPVREFQALPIRPVNMPRRLKAAAPPAGYAISPPNERDHRTQIRNGQRPRAARPDRQQRSKQAGQQHGVVVQAATASTSSANTAPSSGVPNTEPKPAAMPHRQHRPVPRSTARRARSGRSAQFRPSAPQCPRARPRRRTGARRWSPRAPWRCCAASSAWRLVDPSISRVVAAIRAPAQPEIDPMRPEARQRQAGSSCGAGQACSRSRVEVQEQRRGAAGQQRRRRPAAGCAPARPGWPGAGVGW